MCVCFGAVCRTFFSPLKREISSLHTASNSSSWCLSLIFFQHAPFFMLAGANCCLLLLFVVVYFQSVVEHSSSRSSSHAGKRGERCHSPIYLLLSVLFLALFSLRSIRPIDRWKVVTTNSFLRMIACTSM